MRPEDAVLLWLATAGLICWPLLGHIVRDERRKNRPRRRWFRRT